MGLLQSCTELDGNEFAVHQIPSISRVDAALQR